MDRTRARIASTALIALASCAEINPPPPELREEATKPRAPLVTPPQVGGATLPSRPSAVQATEVRAEPQPRPERELVFSSRYESAVAFPGSLARSERRMWRRLAPEVEVIRVRSSIDGGRQPALFYDSGSERKRPL